MIEDLLVDKKPLIYNNINNNSSFEAAIVAIDENFDLLDGDHIVIETQPYYQDAIEPTSARANASLTEAHELVNMLDENMKADAESESSMQKICTALDFLISNDKYKGLSHVNQRPIRDMILLFHTEAHLANK